MKLQDLFEMPDFIDKDIEPFPFQTNTLSVDTINRSFGVIKKVLIKKHEGWICLKKDQSVAVIGYLSNRKPDNKPAMTIVGEVEFKASLDLSWVHEIIVESKGALQVDGASVLSAFHGGSIATGMYFALAEVGYVILSDTTQYRGGRKLWGKLIAFSKASNCAVYIIDNGKVLMDNDKPLIYNGSNYLADDIWATKKSSPDGSKRHVLLALKRIS